MTKRIEFETDSANLRISKIDFEDYITIEEVDNEHIVEIAFNDIDEIILALTEIKKGNL